jgi:addiction module HigA family antidote
MNKLIIKAGRPHKRQSVGTFIKRVYLEPLGISANSVARSLNVSNSTFSRLLKGETSLSPEMAIKLSKVFGRSAESWLALQGNYSIWKLEKEMDTSHLKRIKIA